MPEQQKIIDDLNKCTAELMAHLLVFTDDNFCTRPAEGKWSVAYVAEHLMLLDKIANHILKGPGAVANRAPDEKLKDVDRVLGNMELQLNSPEFIEPQGIIKTKEEGIALVLAGREKMVALIAQNDMSEIGLAEKHPAFGAFTRMEWVYFVIHHSNRHLAQLERLAGAVAAS